MDKKRAQKIQLKKREDISDAEESRRRRRARSPLPRTPLATIEPRKVMTSTISASSSTAANLTPAGTGGALAKKRKKRVQVRHVLTISHSGRGSLASIRFHIGLEGGQHVLLES